MKEILIDIYKTKDIFSGLGQFSFNFAEEIMLNNPVDFKIDFLTASDLLNDKNKNFNFVKANFQKRYFPSLNKKYDIWHSLHQFPAHFPNKASKYILTVHDLNFLIEKNESKASKYLKRLQQNINRADVVTAISNYTKKLIEDNIDLKGKSIHTIYNGVKLNSLTNLSKPEYVNRKRFFFAISVFKVKKNFHVLLPLMKHFEEYQLIIAGNNNTIYGEQIRREIKDLNLEDRVILPGKISDEERLWLYHNCDAFMVPSLAEGFGLPVIEAMKVGKPVFLSNATCLPEIGGDAAFYIDNFEETYMVAFIKEKLKHYQENVVSLSEQIKLHAEKFSWKTSIEAYLKLYSSL